MRIVMILVFIFQLTQLGYSQSEKSGLDTVFCDIQNTSYIILPEEVTLVDVGNPDQYAAQIKGNLVFIKPTQKEVPPTTILIKSGKIIYHGTLVYNKTGKTKSYYYEIKSAGETNTVKKEAINSDVINKSGKKILLWKLLFPTLLSKKQNRKLPENKIRNKNTRFYFAKCGCCGNSDPQ